MMLIYTEIFISVKFNQFNLAKELKFTGLKSPKSTGVSQTFTTWELFHFFAITQSSSRSIIIQLNWMHCRCSSLCQDVTSGAKSHTYLYHQRRRSYRKQVTCNFPPKLLSFLQQPPLHLFSFSSARLNDLSLTPVRQHCLSMFHVSF